MDNLNKQQLVLLTILVSFVTSIGTGITTVSLLDEASPTITQTINRVVEKTIEKVTPVEVTKEVPKEVTVVVRQEDETIKALEKNSKSIVRLKVTDKKGVESFLGLGIVVSKDGLVLGDRNILPKEGSLSGVFADGVHPLTIIKADEKENFVLFKAEGVTSLTPVTFADSNSIRLGQTVVAITGQDKNSVSIGILSGVGEQEAVVPEGAAPKKSVYSLDTSFSLSGVISGSPVIDLNGLVIGIKIGSGSGADVFKAGNVAKTFISAP